MLKESITAVQFPVGNGPNGNGPHKGNRQRSAPVLLLAVLLLGFAIGCGKAAPELETWPVHGTVVDQKGKPVARGAVQFLSVKDAYLNTAGATGPDGSYAIRSFRRGFVYEGAVAGTYRVIVIHGEGGAQYEVPEPFTVEPKENELAIKIKR